MKNYALLKFDQNDSFWQRVFHKEKYYKFPIVYEDGFISHHKEVSRNHGKAWGFVCKGYVVSLSSTPEMFPDEAQSYCKEHSFAGRPFCIPPRAVIKKVFAHIFAINDMIKTLGGTTFINDWYMAQNDKWGDFAGRSNPNIILAVHPQAFDYGVCLCLGKNAKAKFYPAVKL